MAPASAGDFSEELYDRFIEKHIALKPDWLAAALSYLDVKAKPSSCNAVCALVYEQWKYADLSKTTYPTLRPVHNNHFKFEGNCVLQVVSCIDIATSALAQIKACTIGEVDNAEFSSLPAAEKEEASRYQPKVRRMLKLKLSDGESSIDAIEYLPIPWLEPTILPGSKLLFAQSIDCRRGILLLTPNNCQKLGGQVAKLFATNLYTQILAKKLNKKLRITNGSGIAAPTVPMMSHVPPSVPSTSLANPRSSIRPVTVTAPKTYSFGMSAQNPIVLTADSPLRNNFFPRSSTPRVGAPTPEESLRMVLEIEDDLSNDGFDPHPTEQREQQIPTNRIDEDIVPETPPLDDSFENDDFSIFLEPEQMEQLKRLREQEQLSAPSSSEPPAKKSAPVSRLSTPLLDSTNTRINTTAAVGVASPTTFSDDDDDFVKKTSPPKSQQWKAPAKKLTLSKKKPSATQRTLQSFLPPAEHPIPKNIIEVKKEAESDDDIMILSPVKKEPNEDVRPSTSHSYSLDSSSIRQRAVTDSSLTADPFVQKFKSLSLRTIASSLKFMKFAVGSKRFDLIAIVTETVRPLRVVDGEWSMTLAIEDESSEYFECVVAHSLLCELIGLTPQEAETIRSGTNDQRKRDGANRIASIKEQLGRLDLIFTIELFAKCAVTPLICGLDTLTSRLLSI